MVTGRPIRIIPFDLGRKLTEKDISDIQLLCDNRYNTRAFQLREEAITKDCWNMAILINQKMTAFIYYTGIVVVNIEDDVMNFDGEEMHYFSINYGENRKIAHQLLFDWEHKQSETLKLFVRELRSIITRNTKKTVLRKSGSEDFENNGMSYVMTLSLFDVGKDVLATNQFDGYPAWLKRNICALLDPALLFLEDSSKLGYSLSESTNLKELLDDIDTSVTIHDYEKHRNINTYMSWAAVIAIGQLTDNDIHEYIALEMQLQSDWYYTYCIDKSINDNKELKKDEVIGLQRQAYELDILSNRIYDFDDSSMPTRVIELQRGLVLTSGLEEQLHHLKRKISYILEREKLNTELKQKKLSHRSEILLFIIAFIEIAPTVAEYGNLISPGLGTIVNCLIVILGLVIMVRKE